MLFLATSIIPLEKVVPKSIPIDAINIITFTDATFEPNDEFKKFTASLLTPTTKSDIAKINSITIILKYTASIFYF